jgi:hypothetical protein
MNHKSILGIKILAVVLFTWSSLCTYVNLINTIAAGRPFIQSNTKLFTSFAIIVQSILFFIINLLFVMNATHIYKLKKYALKEMLILIIISAFIHISTNFLIFRSLIFALSNYAFFSIILLFILLFLNRPNIKKLFKT